MSAVAYQLFRRGPTWWVRTKLPTGRETEFSTGSTDRAKADGIAEVKTRTKHATSAAGRVRWQRMRARKAAVLSAVRDNAPAGETAQAPPATPPMTPPEAPGGPRRTPADDARRAEIAGKLRALGDAQNVPLEPDEVAAPAGETTAGDGGAGPANDNAADNEAGELLADMMAVGTLAAFVRLNSRIAARQKPPKRLGEPHDKAVDWAGEGLRFQYRRLVGNAGALGPWGKLCVGLVGMGLTMWWGAEDLTPPKEAPPAASEARPAPPRSNGTPAAPPASSYNGALALGRFA